MPMDYEFVGTVEAENKNYAWVLAAHYFGGLLVRVARDRGRCWLVYRPSRWGREP